MTASMSGSNVRIALVGAGPMAAHHARAMAEVPGVTVVACCSRSRTKAEAFAATHAIAQARTFDELRRAPQADALVVAAPVDAMASVAVELATFGLPMLLEKPVGLGLAESAAVAQRITSPAMVGLNRRFYEVVLRGRERLASAGGVRFVEAHMPEDVRSLPEKYGRALRERWQYVNSIHLVDQMRYMAGEPVTINTHNRQRDWWDRSHVGFVTFDGGARGVFNSQWFAPGSWRLALYAEDLQVIHQPMERATVHRRGESPELIEPSGADARIKPGLVGQATAFATWCRTGRKPEGAADLADYVRSVALVESLTAIESEIPSTVT
jgi:predicted dehydrogenase